MDKLELYCDKSYQLTIAYSNSHNVTKSAIMKIKPDSTVTVLVHVIMMFRSA